MKKQDLEVGVPYAHVSSKHSRGKRVLLMDVGQLWTRSYSTLRRGTEFFVSRLQDNRPEGSTGYLVVMERGVWKRQGGSPLPEVPLLEPDALSSWSHPDWYLTTINNRHLTGPWDEYVQQVHQEQAEHKQAEQERRQLVDSAHQRFDAARATISMHADVAHGAWHLGLRYPSAPDVEINLTDLVSIAAALNNLTGELHRLRGSEDA